ncbi:hypothetical protein [Hydrogenimonas sp. SS33]|uniref:hypothetical protein n=1 Tax=Hydrogenimonas leucolamina TaxID=2954236 RepID=UPI00336BFA5A
MQAFLIFLAAVAILVAIGYFYPTKTHKTPQNNRELRQGDTTRWLDEINASSKKR